MYIQKSITGTNGIVTTHHGLIDAIASCDLSQITARFQSWPDEAARLAGMASVDRINVGIAVDSLDASAGLAAAITAAVLATDDFSGGEVITDAAETLGHAKDRKWDEIKRARDGVEFGKLEWDGSVFDADRASQARIQGAVLLAMQAEQAGLPMTLHWTLADNSVRELSSADLVALGQALGARVAAAYETARQVRVDIEAATTTEDVSAIHWP